MTNLHCFTDEFDTVIAESVEDAREVLREHLGSAADWHDPDSWEQLSDADEITIHCDENGAPATPGDPGVAPVTKTAAAWVCQCGRGFLCTTEY